MAKLKDLRETAGLSQSVLARKSGLSVRTLQDYEQGRRDINGIGIKRAAALVAALGCNIEDLLTE
jgi:transcriptional regulator with XRE-family HTH domain